jgi:hypothetical protein
MKANQREQRPSASEREIAELRVQLAEARETLEASRTGAVGAPFGLFLPALQANVPEIRMSRRVDFPDGLGNPVLDPGQRLGECPPQQMAECP